MTAKPEENQTIDGFLRYDAFPSRSFKARGLEDPRFGRPIEVRGGNAKPVRSVAWSSDGKRIATGTEGKGLRVWDVRPGGSGVEGTGTALKSPHNGNVAALAWSPTEPTVLLSGCKTSNSGGIVAVWDAATSTSPLASFKIPGDVLHVAWHPSGEQFAAVCPRSTRDEVFFYWRKDGKWEQRNDIMIGGAGVDIGVVEINSLRFWKGGDAVLCVSNEGSLNAWWYPTEERPPLALSPTPEKEEPEEAKDDEPPAKKQRLDTEPKDGSEEKEPEAETGDADEEAAALAEKSARDEEPEVEVEAAAEAPEGDAPDGEAADGETAEATEGAEGEVAEGEATTGEDGAETEEPATTEDAEEKPEGTTDVTIEVTAADGTPATPAEDVDMSSAPTPAAASTAAPSPQPSHPGTPQATGEEKEAAAKAAAARELERRKHKQLLPCFRQNVHPASLLALALHPQGKYLAVGGQDARISLFTARDWLLERTFHQAEGAIRHIAFSPDGELLAVGGDDKVLHVISVWTKATVARFPVSGVVNSVAWSPVRNTLAWSVNVKTGVVWYMASQENEGA